MKLTTEYLFIVEKSSAEALYHFCTQVADFKKLLQADNAITFDKNHLVFKGNKKYPIEIRTNKVAGKEQRFFYLTITFDGGEDGVLEFEELLRAIRSVARTSGAIPETLWDDISLYYSERSYPLVHKAESLMRKLITYFMLTTIGKEWVKQTSPGAFKEAVEKSKRSQYYDVLHQVDFIQLGDFLFKSYPNRDSQELLALISQARKADDIKLEDLQGFVARSNWDRYFSKIVDCNDEYLNKRWKALYDLRCMVAHNALVNREDYGKIVKLVAEIEQPLQKAIDNLDKVHVPKEDREQIAENAAQNLGPAYGEFLLRWKEFEAAVADAHLMCGLAFSPPENGRRRQPMDMLSELRSEGIVGPEFMEIALQVRNFRYQVVHGTESPPSEQDLIVQTGHIRDLTRDLLRLFRQDQSWRDELVAAIQTLGGEASLDEIYEYIERQTTRTLAENWRASIRYTLQLHSPNTETHKRGGEAVFRRVSRGRYALPDPKNKPKA